MLETTLQDAPQALRGTPEGRLWTAVLSSAIIALEQVKEFYEHGYEDRIESLRQHYWTGRERAGETLKLSRDQAKDRLREINKITNRVRAARQDTEWFFFTQDSSFLWICHVMEYNAETIRRGARRTLERIKELEEQAEIVHIRSIVDHRVAQAPALRFPHAPGPTTTLPRSDPGRPDTVSRRLRTAP